MTRKTVLIYGGTGYIGSAITEVLRKRPCDVIGARAPRVRLDPSTPLSQRAAIAMRHARTLQNIENVDIIINAAGSPNPTRPGGEIMEGANALTPGIIAIAARGRTLIHISSSATQGTHAPLDSTARYAPESQYGSTKARGEQLLTQLASDGFPSIVFRPPGVHSPTRRTTRSIASYAAGPVRVTSSRPRNTPQALLTNVACAIEHIVTHIDECPPIVHYPSESLSTVDLLELLGQRVPRTLPDKIAVGVVETLRKYPLPILNGHFSRFHVLLLGQQQEPSWLTATGWQPPHGREHWDQMGRKILAQGSL